MNCNSCDREARAACRKCGEFYCGRHGARSAFGPLCSKCFNRLRPLNWFGFFLSAALGVLGLWIVSSAGEMEEMIVGICCLLTVPFGIRGAYEATRQFPTSR